jgi:hypothetical protein
MFRKGEAAAAVYTLLGFEAPLRPAELFRLKVSDVSCDLKTNRAVVSLGLTKSGKRDRADESITLASPLVVPMLAVLCASKGPDQRLYIESGAAYRKLFHVCCCEFGLHEHEFKPYSFRLDGATAALEKSANLAELMIRGRWQNMETAQIDLNSGLAALATMRLSAQSRETVNQEARFLHHILKGREKN